MHSFNEHCYPWCSLMIRTTGQSGLVIDASNKDAILVSSGTDESIKIWGLDFGDTHHTMYGHWDSVTNFRFVPGTHNFFTCRKDPTVRYWDCNRFEQVLLLEGHAVEINFLVAKWGGWTDR